MKQFFGKYRGKVENNVDPMKLGRIQVSVPTIYGDGKTNWAMPCVPYAGNKVGWFVLPPKNANVWVEFEGGDIDYPIWAGCFWGSGECPAKPPIAEMKTFKTEGIELILNDSKGSGGLTLKVGSPAVSPPATLVINSKGIQVTTQGAKLRITPALIELSLEPGSLKLTTGSVELKHEGATATLQQFKVALNKNSLEIY